MNEDAHKEKRQFQREDVSNSKILKTILFGSSKADDYVLENISEGGIQVSGKSDLTSENKIFNGMFKYLNEKVLS